MFTQERNERKDMEADAANAPGTTLPPIAPIGIDMGTMETDTIATPAAEEPPKLRLCQKALAFAIQ
eukprot:4315181-Prorocentrum_lima.AAC.1